MTKATRPGRVSLRERASQYLSPADCPDGRPAPRGGSVVMVNDAARSQSWFYTLSAFAVELADLPESMQKKLPRYPRLPATLLGRLAAHERFPGRDRFFDGCTGPAHQKAAEIASLAVVADAKDAAALNSIESSDSPNWARSEPGVSIYGHHRDLIGKKDNRTVDQRRLSSGKLTRYNRGSTGSLLSEHAEDLSILSGTRRSKRRCDRVSD